ncbi:cytochrome C oxidase subunit IV family protein [Mycolicibacterium sp.]|uniref:cytochrome C oxidase subunit IV family protein n=1 Tax=Mycolicibacterium sp. TaxID=2320850 RepID=UPI0025F8B68F|nr:cytochrome C oxidase subunit IV family protein [Mycolicibacterium sp.]
MVWLILMSATVVNWWLGRFGVLPNVNSEFVQITIIALAMIKAGLIGNYFMELRTAPDWLRHGFNTLMVLVSVLLIALS